MFMTQSLILLTTMFGVLPSCALAYNLCYCVSCSIYGANSQEESEIQILFMKVLTKGRNSQYCSINYVVFSDFFLSTELIPKKRLNKWIQRKGFKIRKILIMKWIILGNFLTMGYKSNLLPTLVTISYDKAIDALVDLERSGLPLVIPGGGTIEKAIEKDGRPLMKQAYKKGIKYTFNGKPPPKLFEM